MRDVAVSAFVDALAAILVKSHAVVGVATLLAVMLIRSGARTRRGVWTAATISVAGLASWELGHAALVALTVEPVASRTFLLPDGISLFIDGAAPNSPAWWQQGIVAAWLSGMALLAVSALHRALVRHRLIARAGPSAHDAEVAAIAARLGTTPPRVRATDAILTAAISGGVRPILLLGPAMATWSSEQRRQVIIHELAHVRAGDPFLAMVARVIRTVLWLVPAAWLLVSRLRSAQEFASDDAVLDAGEEAASYASTLLDVACDVRARPVALVGMASPAIAHRIEAILDRPAERPRQRDRTALAFAALLTSAVVIVAAPMPSTSGSGISSSGTTDLRSSVGRPPDGSLSRLRVDRDAYGRVQVRPMTEAPR